MKDKIPYRITINQQASLNWRKLVHFTSNSRKTTWTINAEKLFESFIAFSCHIHTKLLNEEGGHLWVNFSLLFKIAIKIATEVN